jgi:ABC-2 type transport system permease protein
VEAGEVFGLLGAIYPISLMPGWLKVISHLNPLTYEVDALRALMLAGGTSVFGLGLDLSIPLMVTALLVIIGGRMYPRIAI